MTNRVPRVGDTIRVRPARVIEVDLGTPKSNGWVRCYGGNTYGFDEIEEIVPRKLQIGDEVRVKESRYHSSLASPIRGKIAGVHEEWAWVNTAAGPLTIRIENLELIS